VLPADAREAGDIILYAAKAKTGVLGLDEALRQIRSYRATTLVSELVKAVTIVELTGIRDDSLSQSLKHV